jgi:hypothetical protein
VALLPGEGIRAELLSRQAENRGPEKLLFRRQLKVHDDDLPSVRLITTGGDATRIQDEMRTAEGAPIPVDGKRHASRRPGKPGIDTPQ